MSFSTLLDLWVWFLSAALVVLVARIAWFRASGQLAMHPEWNASEQQLARRVAGGLAAAAIVSGLIAIYVATQVPWVDNLPALLPNPPKVVAGKIPTPISTAAYLFPLPLSLAVFAAILRDPWGIRQVRFRAPSREVGLRALLAIGILAAGYSAWRSIEALIGTALPS